MSYKKTCKSRTFKKSNIKKIILTVFVTVLVLALVSNISTALRKDTKVIHPLFVSGIIDTDTGDIRPCEYAIYTKDFIECSEVIFDVPYEKEFVYVVAFYDEEKNYTGFEENIDSNKFVSNSENNFSYIKVYIAPDDGKSIEFYEIPKWTSQITITVNKD